MFGWSVQRIESENAQQSAWPESESNKMMQAQDRLPPRVHAVQGHTCSKHGTQLIGASVPPGCTVYYKYNTHRSFGWQGAIRGQLYRDCREAVPAMLARLPHNLSAAADSLCETAQTRLRDNI
jgi:hypothetical protein